MSDTELQSAVERVENLFTIAGMECEAAQGGIHYTLSCHRFETGHYSINCACGWFSHTGRSAGGAHALMRAHVAGHRDAVPDDVR